MKRDTICDTIKGIAVWLITCGLSMVAVDFCSVLTGDDPSHVASWIALGAVSVLVALRKP